EIFTRRRFTPIRIAGESPRVERRCVAGVHEAHVDCVSAAYAAAVTRDYVPAKPEEKVEMKRVIVDHFGGPEVVKVVEDDVPKPGQGEVRVRVLAAGVSFTDSQLRAGTDIPGGPKPPFTPGYELVGVVEELGPGCSRLHVGDRIGALTVWGADA